MQEIIRGSKIQRAANSLLSKELVAKSTHGNRLIRDKTTLTA